MKKKLKPNLEKLSPERKAVLDRYTKKSRTIDSGLERGSGVMNTELVEPVPSINQAANEKVIRGDNNTFIVLGTDRPSNIASGYGGVGAAGAGAIDIVVGRQANTSTGPVDGKEADPNFFTDAARIYISQKTDLDKNFAIMPGIVEQKPGRSGIGIKADYVNIIGRAGVKIVTGKAQVTGLGGDGEKNALGGSIADPAPPIELIAGNNTNNLQPVILGDNLVECLTEMLKLIQEVHSLFLSFATAQMQFNAAAAIDPLRPWVPTAGAAATVQQLNFSIIPSIMNRINLVLAEFNHLKPMGPTEGGYICSRNVFTT